MGLKIIGQKNSLNDNFAMRKYLPEENFAVRKIHWIKNLEVKHFGAKSVGYEIFAG